MPTTRGRKKSDNWLIFVDTNVLLDFYRLGGESADRQLAALERHKDRIIMNDQVHMEFLKNRQKVIQDSLKQFDKPKHLQAPPIINDTKTFRAIQKNTTEALSRHSELRKKIEKVLRSPIRSDRVFQAINRLYEHESEFNIKRPNKVRLQIRRLAFKRFMLGHPPRKMGDFSIGDAVNWETIIYCASISKLNHNILIVSRDNDFGVTYDKDTILNDWLRREFKERVSRKRNIELTNKLTIALKKLDEAVLPDDEREEQKLIKAFSDQFDDESFA